MAKKPKSVSLMLDGVRGKWFSLAEPDTTYGKDGSYGIGVILDDASAQKVSAAHAEIGAAANVPFGTFSARDVLTVKMRASGENRKTGERWEEKPLVFNPDMSPATAEDLNKLSRKSKLKVSVTCKSYDGVGNNPDGVSNKLVGVQILAYDGGDLSAEELGFSSAVTDSSNDNF